MSCLSRESEGGKSIATHAIHIRYSPDFSTLQEYHHMSMLDALTQAGGDQAISRELGVDQQTAQSGMAA